MVQASQGFMPGALPTDTLKSVTIFSCLSFCREFIGNVWGLSRSDLRVSGSQEVIFLSRWRGNKAFLEKTSLAVQQGRNQLSIHILVESDLSLGWSPRMEGEDLASQPCLSSSPNLGGVSGAAASPGLCNHSNIAAAFIPRRHGLFCPHSGAGS